MSSCLAIMIISIVINLNSKKTSEPENEEISSSSIINSESPSENLDTNSEMQSKTSSSKPEEINVAEENYQKLFPDLYVDKPKEFTKKNKTAYLTFDDGPSKLTERVLDILKEADVKATFFVIGASVESNKQTAKRIVDEGHTIAVHTYSHDYKQIYASVKDYLSDFDRVFNLIYEVTGTRANIFRFPGGSINGFNKSNYKDFCDEMLRRGFVCYDWNNSCGDCGSNYSVANCVRNVVNDASVCDRVISLMHDAPAKKYTVDALPEIIQKLKDQGFSLEKLTNEVQPITFQK